MLMLRCYSQLPFSCLLFASAVSLGGFAQSSTQQTKPSVVAPPTATKQWTGDLDVLFGRLRELLRPKRELNSPSFHGSSSISRSACAAATHSASAAAPTVRIAPAANRIA